MSANRGGRPCKSCPYKGKEKDLSYYGDGKGEPEKRWNDKGGKYPHHDCKPKCHPKKCKPDCRYIPPMSGCEGHPLKVQDWCLLEDVNEFDTTRKVRYIPFRPEYLVEPPNGPFPPQYKPGEEYPWFYPVIPFEVVPPPVPEGLPNGDGYEKFIAINYYLPFYAGIDPFTFQEDDPRATLFQVNLLDRGPANYRKKVYMMATRSCLMKVYNEKINEFLLRVYADITTYSKPIVSSLKKNILDFFFDIHLGTADYPECVVEYFDRFINLISYQNQQYYDNENGKGAWDRELMRGWQLSDSIYSFFQTRLDDVIEKEDETSLAYWWITAGLDRTAVVTECLHNIFAFGTLIVMGRSMIVDSISGIPYPPPPLGPGPIQYNFFGKYTDAATPVEKNNVVREFMRLTSPSISTTSKVISSSEDPNEIQSRHIHQLIMAENEAVISGGNPLAYFQYDTSKYDDWPQSFVDLECLNGDGAECPCPHIGPQNPAVLNNPADQFGVESDGTIIDKSAPKTSPIYELPRYMPFGLGYRRCAAEGMVTFIANKMLQVFGQVEYEARDPADYPTIGIAFVTRVPDNIFVIQPLAQQAANSGSQS